MRKEIIGAATLYLGDCLCVLKAMPDSSVDSIVTDPPYGLSFMGKKWDYDVPSVEVWAECLRVLQPGGHLLAFAGTRTQHRMAARIEDAGFEIRDMIAWVYGSGFPKSLNVAKAVDSQITLGGSSQSQMRKRDMGDEYRPHKNAGTEGFGDGNLRKGADGDRDLSAAADLQAEAARQWQGWGTALKPALEPITVARKPLIGTVAENVLAHGTGALNIDGCRVPTDDNLGGGAEKATTPDQKGNDGWVRPWMDDDVAREEHAARVRSNVARAEELGRFPANLIHDGSDEVLAAFPQAPGQIAKAAEGGDRRKDQNTYGVMTRGSNGAPPRADAGSAARFFYCAKASKKDRGEGNTHPTVKPTELMRYLCRLVTPPGGVVLDPFMGSGSTGKAAILEGFAFIGIERERESFDTAVARIGRAGSARTIAAAEVAQMELI